MLPRKVNRRVGKALHAYDMLADGDRVLVAVSGGVDSLVLAWMLRFWQRKAPIAYHLHAVHIDMEADAQNGRGEKAVAVEKQVQKLKLPYTILPTIWRPPVNESMQGPSSSGDEKDICYLCAKHRRKQLFEFARQGSFNKLALGHHRDDIIETFFLNICFAGNISTMVPRQELFGGRLALIRPLSFLEKHEIISLAEELQFEPVPTNCPLGEETKRMAVRRILADLYSQVPQAKMRIFSALSNVRSDYLLKPAGAEEA